MLGDEHRSATVAQGEAELEQRGGARCVQLCEGLVEHEHARLEDERARDRDALALATAQRGDGSRAQGLQTQPVKHRVDARAHQVGRDTEVLETEGDISLDGGVHGLPLGVLEHEPHRPRQATSRRAQHVMAVDAGAPADVAAVHVRDHAVEQAQERGLAAP